MSLREHLAEGPIAGALFQPERALYWLAKSPRGSRVGIEVLDDIAVDSGDGLLILEQDKSSIGAAPPLGDRSQNLWNTLATWLSAVRDGEVELSKTRFFLVTNKQLSPSWVQRLQSGAANKADRTTLAHELRKLGKKPPKTIKANVTTVLSFSDSEIADLLMRTIVEDASNRSAGSGAHDQIVSLLHIAPGCDPGRVLEALLGWVVSTTLTLLRARQPAWLEGSAFDRRLLETQRDMVEVCFRERAASLLKVSDAQRAEQMSRLFVEQVRLLGFDDEGERIIDAIDDVLRCEAEMTRFAKEGSITEDSVLAFNDSLLDRWRSVFRRHCRALGKANPQCEADRTSAGQDIYEETLDHREMLAGQPTQQQYLTRGAYHRIADRIDGNGKPALGWHPDFASHLTPKAK